MGYASYLEDIRERATDFIRRLDGIREILGKPYSELREGKRKNGIGQGKHSCSNCWEATRERKRLNKEIEEAASGVQGIVGELNKLLDMATDPEIELAKENSDFKKEIETLNGRIRKYEMSVKELRERDDRAQAAIKRRDDKIKELKSQIEYHENPEAFYEMQFNRRLR